MKRILGLSLFFGLSAQAADSPQISRSVGAPDGVVVLWPRVVPATESPEIRRAAAGVQAVLSQLVADGLPGREVDVRPEPERVCPQAGCKAVAVGALLVHTEQACAVVGVLSPPGRSPATLVPWAGKVTTKQPTIPFREYPESYVTILDFQRCDALPDVLKQASPAVHTAILAAAGASSSAP
jgi:hypothetical protein